MMPSRSSLRVQIRKSRQEHDNKQEHHHYHHTSEEPPAHDNKPQHGIEDNVGGDWGWGGTDWTVLNLCSSQETTRKQQAATARRRRSCSLFSQCHHHHRHPLLLLHRLVRRRTATSAGTISFHHQARSSPRWTNFCIFVTSRISDKKI